MLHDAVEQYIEKPGAEFRFRQRGDFGGESASLDKQRGASFGPGATRRGEVARVVHLDLTPGGEAFARQRGPTRKMQRQLPDRMCARNGVRFGLSRGEVAEHVVEVGSMPGVAFEGAKQLISNADWLGQHSV